MVEKNEDKKDERVASIIARTALHPVGDEEKGLTYITRFQAILFPLLDTIIDEKNYIIDVATYLEKKAMAEFKKDKVTLKKLLKTIPDVPDPAKEMLHSTTLWNKSVGGAHIKRAFDLAETDLTSQGHDDDMFKEHGFEDED
jgi:hypothetical protein